MIGTPLFIVHGVNDSEPNGRPRYTDVVFARTADRLLREAGADVVYAEHGGGHGLITAGESLAKLVDWTRGKKRDPFYQRVVAVTPRGWDCRSEPPAPDHRWVSILDIGDGQVEYDSMTFSGPAMKWGEPPENWAKQQWTSSTAMIKGGIVDAELVGPNRFVVKTANVRTFSLWLHPAMIDFAKPVVVTINNQPATEHSTPRPNLLDALRSFERRHDWGLIYHAELVIDVNVE